MFPVPKLWLYIGAATIITAILGTHLFNDRRTKLKLEETRVQLVQSQERLKKTEDMLLEATRSREQFQQQAKVADEAREQVRKDLQQKLDKVRVQPAPAECKEAVKWVKKHRELLK